MINNQKIIEEILGIAVSTGADFAEVYWELTRNGNITLLGGKIDCKTFGYPAKIRACPLTSPERVEHSTGDLLQTKCCFIARTHFRGDVFKGHVS